jgi:hypothetical protein
MDLPSKVGPVLTAELPREAELGKGDSHLPMMNHYTASRPGSPSTDCLGEPRAQKQLRTVCKHATSAN